MSVSPDALQERTRGARATLWRLVGPWWLFLLTAIAWLILAGVAQRFTPASIATVGVLLGFWASQQFLSVKGALLLVWVGLFALFRGISEIVIAFEVRGRQTALAADEGMRRARHCLMLTGPARLSLDPAFTRIPAPQR